jgi:exodeoxyribonuclease VII small subunit
MDKTKAALEISGLSFEEALAELDAIVARLEKGQAALEESIALYERGTALKAHCEGKLKAAQAKIEKIVIASDGQVGTQPLDVA